MKSSSGIAGHTPVVLFFLHRSDNYSNGNRRTALHDDVTYVTFSNVRNLLALCPSRSTHYGFNPAVVGYSLYRRTCSTKVTIPFLVSNQNHNTVPNSE